MRLEIQFFFCSCLHLAFWLGSDYSIIVQESVDHDTVWWFFNAPRWFDCQSNSEDIGGVKMTVPLPLRSIWASSIWSNGLWRSSTTSTQAQQSPIDVVVARSRKDTSIWMSRVACLSISSSSTLPVCALNNLILFRLVLFFLLNAHVFPPCTGRRWNSNHRWWVSSRLVFLFFTVESSEKKSPWKGHFCNWFQAWERPCHRILPWVHASPLLNFSCSVNTMDDLVDKSLRE